MFGGRGTCRGGGRGGAGSCMVDDPCEQRLTQMKTQECIPVGCVPTAAVAITRCQYWGGGSRSATRGGVAQPFPVDRITDRRF